MKHTATRILETDEMFTAIEERKKLINGQRLELDLHYKISCDGMGSLTQFQQKGPTLNKDSHCVATMFCPLQLTTQNDDGSTAVLFTNPYANSAWGQRPLRISYEKETKGKYHNCHMEYLSSI